MEYTMEFVDASTVHDEVIDSNGAMVIIAPMAQMFLFGTEIDYEAGLLESGFKFKNPNIVIIIFSIFTLCISLLNYCYTIFIVNCINCI